MSRKVSDRNATKMESPLPQGSGARTGCTQGPSGAAAPGHPHGGPEAAPGAGRHRLTAAPGRGGAGPGGSGFRVRPRGPSDVRDSVFLTHDVTCSGTSPECGGRGERRHRPPSGCDVPGPLTVSTRLLEHRASREERTKGASQTETHRCAPRYPLQRARRTTAASLRQSPASSDPRATSFHQHSRRRQGQEVPARTGGRGARRVITVAVA